MHLNIALHAYLALALGITLEFRKYVEVDLSLSTDVVQVDQ